MVKLKGGIPTNLGEDKNSMKYKFQSYMEGGLLISSKLWLDGFSDEVGYRLSILLDVDGRSELTFDYPDRSWDDVWQQQANYFLELGQSGTAISIVFREGLYQVHINLNQPLPTESIHVSNLRIENNSIFIAEAGDFLETYFSGEKYENFEELIITTGLYEVYCTIINTDPEKIFNIYFKQVNQFSSSRIKGIICI